MRWIKWVVVALVIASIELTIANVAVTQDNPSPSTGASTPTQNNNYLEKLPPLIDREIFFGNPKISGAKLSPDGKFIAFERPFNGVMNVWVKRLEEPFEAARPITADTNRPIPGYFWSRDGRYIVYTQDKGGNENFHIYAADASATAVQGSKAPPARDLTPSENVQA
ncbi:MAG TPA: hypothetical protein V6D48_10485, partial [Oculatellaceae cyanobacterium]